MAVLCGNTPETCYNKYGSTTVRLKCCHELFVKFKRVEIFNNKPVILSCSMLLRKGADNKCSHCGHSVHQAGPIYIAPIHNRLFVDAILSSLRETPEEERLSTP
ncbi:hypothetical protein DICVIV_07948 [Dictyocaulus viviparus]|uniref:tRNA (guanine(26)-N(2))-dimethyltransferase n=1 Tax=Dictyocaulus viviparus TaxID=29172 RepID=A0A0D8XN68_DICVI|nr:hypothetical protein DICVIV_07948 [Dictyocaulus viviparus]